MDFFPFDRSTHKNSTSTWDARAHPTCVLTQWPTNSMVLDPPVDGVDGLGSTLGWNLKLVVNNGNKPTYQLVQDVWNPMKPCK